MVRREIVRGRMGQVRGELLECLESVTDELLPWAPTEGMRTVAGQLAEILVTEMQIVAVLREEPGGDYRAHYQEMIATPTKAGFLAQLDSVRTHTLATLDGYSEEELLESIEMDPNWFESGGLEQVPRIEVFGAIPMHEWYHTGQLISYLWSRGVNPYS